jgi:hypothetical protein
MPTGPPNFTEIQHAGHVVLLLPRTAPSCASFVLPNDNTIRNRAAEVAAVHASNGEIKCQGDPSNAAYELILAFLAPHTPSAFLAPHVHSEGLSFVEIRQQCESLEQQGATAAALSSAALPSRSRGIDDVFALMRCQKAFPPAVQLYKGDQPPLYDTAFHQSQLSKALAAFRRKTCGGKIANKFMAELTAECSAWWADGRQLCESISLFGNGCVLPSSHESSHDTGVTSQWLCACGSTLADPVCDAFDWSSIPSLVNPNCCQVLKTQLFSSNITPALSQRANQVHLCIPSKVPDPSWVQPYNLHRWECPVPKLKSSLRQPSVVSSSGSVDKVQNRAQRRHEKALREAFDRALEEEKRVASNQLPAVLQVGYEYVLQDSAVRFMPADMGNSKTHIPSSSVVPDGSESEYSWGKHHVVNIPLWHPGPHTDGSQKSPQPSAQLQRVWLMLPCSAQLGSGTSKQQFQLSVACGVQLSGNETLTAADRFHVSSDADEPSCVCICFPPVWQLPDQTALMRAKSANKPPSLFLQLHLKSNEHHNRTLKYFYLNEVLTLESLCGTASVRGGSPNIGCRWDG